MLPLSGDMTEVFDSSSWARLFQSGAVTTVVSKSFTTTPSEKTKKASVIMP